MHTVQPQKKPTNVLHIPAPKHRMPCAGKGRATRYDDKRRATRAASRVEFRREDW